MPAADGGKQTAYPAEEVKEPPASAVPKDLSPKVVVPTSSESVLETIASITVTDNTRVGDLILGAPTSEPGMLQEQDSPDLQLGGEKHDFAPVRKSEGEPGPSTMAGAESECAPGFVSSTSESGASPVVTTKESTPIEGPPTSDAPRLDESANSIQESSGPQFPDGDEAEIPTMAAGASDSGEPGVITGDQESQELLEPGQKMSGMVHTQNDKVTRAGIDAAGSESDQNSGDNSAATALEARTPRKYRPTPQSEKLKRRAETADRGPDAAIARAFPVKVRLLFERGGYCKLSLVAERPPELPLQIRLSGTGGEFNLTALTEDWYEVVPASGIASLLQEGVEWVARPTDTVFRWSLSGREIYVLGSSDELSGYVLTARLLIREEHVVLCTAGMRTAVERVLTECCDSSFQLLTEAQGIPEGWFVFRGVIPTRPLAPNEGGSILDCLCPGPDIEISFVGGIRLNRTSWLKGFPPRILLRGDVQCFQSLTIDGQHATRGGDDAFTAPGWDQEDIHVVICDGISRTYEIVNPSEGWTTWPAYSFGRGVLRSSSGSPQRSICGALVRSFKDGASDLYLVVVPFGNPIVIGALPGEILYCPIPQAARRSSYVALVPFEPVWAIPCYPLLADRTTERILLVGSPHFPKRMVSPQRDFRSVNSLRRWCDAVLDCSRKRLALEPSEVSVVSCWQAYKQMAKQIRRSRQ